MSNVMITVMFDQHDFLLIEDMQQQLHNMERSMTLDDQRDFAERWRLLMARHISGINVSCGSVGER